MTYDHALTNQNSSCITKLMLPAVCQQFHSLCLFMGCFQALTAFSLWEEDHRPPKNTLRNSCPTPIL